MAIQDTSTQIILYGDGEDIMKKKENAIVLSNHQSSVDWMLADSLAVRQGSLGHLRYILKDGLKYFPLYGFYFRQHSCIYVKRSGKFSQSKAEKQLKELIEYKTPFWMVVFPEGTRYNPELTSVITKSQDFAKENGRAVLDHVLTPRHKATFMCISQLREVTDAVYDLTVAYSDTKDKHNGHRIPSPSMPDFLSGVAEKIHIHMKRIDINGVPSEEEELKTWLHERFQEKDRLLRNFYSDESEDGGTFGPDGQVTKLELQQTLPAAMFFVVLGTAVLSTSYGRNAYWKVGMLGTLTGWVWMNVSS